MAHVIACQHCGKKETLEDYQSLTAPIIERMRTGHMCFECAYWTAAIESLNDQSIIIGHEVWEPLEPLTKPSAKSSRRKATRFLIRFSDREVFGVSRLSLRGRLPDRFAAKVADTYKFITREQYVRLQEFQADRCRSKGCFDRYHCIWYDADISEPDGPWNQIPKNYKLGGEHCPSFVNKNVIHPD